MHTLTFFAMKGAEYGKKKSPFKETECKTNLTIIAITVWESFAKSLSPSSQITPKQVDCYDDSKIGSIQFL